MYKPVLTYKMSLLLLKTVEELTRHVIEMKKENRKQQELLDNLVKFAEPTTVHKILEH